MLETVALSALTAFLTAVGNGRRDGQAVAVVDRRSSEKDHRAGDATADQP